MTYRIRLSFLDSHASLLYHALRYEEAPQAQIYFTFEKDMMIFECEAESIANLRAAGNSFLQWIAMIEQTVTILNSFSHM